MKEWGDTARRIARPDFVLFFLCSVVAVASKVFGESLRAVLLGTCLVSCWE